jgi:hypothetical protein
MGYTLINGDMVTAAFRGASPALIIDLCCCDVPVAEKVSNLSNVNVGVEKHGLRW